MGKGATIYLKRGQVEICRKLNSTIIEKIKVRNIFYENDTKSENKLCVYEKLEKATQLRIISETQDSAIYLNVESFKFNEAMTSVTYTTF
ncbi:hypothetical protein [Carnobacterium maltaromaticum]|uniref:hypothetical protein n=1 Tax=Carnobacterium maltaromaticum TaxID=2751 RepID=UPI00295ED4A8|nr:hypothetical protein [Carnobacterium maltaromaticum]